MGFDIDIRGFEELKRRLKEMAEGLSIDTVRRWCEVIKEEAEKACLPEHRESIQLEAYPTEHGDFNISVKAHKDAVSHLAKAIRRKLPSMLATTKPLFEAVLKRLEAK